ncbi:hypothetical protein [Nocardioides antri]|uniref:Mce-associated membrane protein n=1 Tax=Nocardioides antri TaxID=2607659 RepID=A0A5B1M4F2_9ACTN|nr:hypothetical protein [Nocardioides antri]KAA1427812.1 hypothetical protein F0U47_10325 [Nocardioides antri]
MGGRFDLVRRLATAPVALALVLMLLLASSGLVWWRGLPPDSSAPSAVAREEAENFFTLHHESVQDDVDKVLALAVGDFKSEYAARREEIVKHVRARKLEVAATIPENGVAVEYLSESEARILVAVDVSSRSEDGVEDQRFRCRLTLRKVDDSWLVAELEQV